MITKRKILEAVLNGDATALNQLPPLVLFSETDNHSNGIYQVTPPSGHTLPAWAKSEMTEEEIEAIKSRYNVVFFTIIKTYE